MDVDTHLASSKDESGSGSQLQVTAQDTLYFSCKGRFARYFLFVCAREDSIILSEVNIVLKIIAGEE